jgi:hypothetical protein
MQMQLNVGTLRNSREKADPFKKIFLNANNGILHVSTKLRSYLSQKSLYCKSR